MVLSVLSFLAFAVGIVHGGTVTFASDTERASITASCEYPEAMTTGLYPNEFDEMHGGKIEVEFKNVITDCVDYKSGVPCVNHSAAFPPQFWCEFSGQLSPDHPRRSVVYGPYSAYNKVMGDKFLPMLDCTTPMHDDISYLSGYEGTPGESEHGFLTLDIWYGPHNDTFYYKGNRPNATAVPHETEAYKIAWGGPAGGNVVAFTGLREPPSPQSPPMPPTAPPPDCVFMHNTLTWSYQYSTTSGCAYRDLNRWRWRTYSSRTWSQCMDLSSNYGVMTAAHTYTTYGWTGHRYNTQASTWQGSWSAISLYAITNSWNCILGREYRNIDIFDEPLGGTTQTNLDFEDYLWLYTDYGPLFYDECRNLAGRAGANMITPFTVGKTTQTGNYWRMSGYNCNAFNWITSTGTTMGYSKPSNYARGVTQNCMIGYRLCEPPE